MHRPMLVFRQPNLLCIDGIPVSPEERTKAELYFMEQQVSTTYDIQSSSKYKLDTFNLKVNFSQVGQCNELI